MQGAKSEENMDNLNPAEVTVVAFAAGAVVVFLVMAYDVLFGDFDLNL